MIPAVALASETLNTTTRRVLPARVHRGRIVIEPRYYLPREVFFARFDFADVFLGVCGSDFSRFFPATSNSFPWSVEAG
jgi:hypothetical protein